MDRKLVDQQTTTSITGLLDGCTSAPVTVKSGVPQGTVLGPLLFLLYINDIGDKLSQGTKIRLFADDCLIYRDIKNQQDCQTLQKDLSGLEKWSISWKMHFNPTKCYVLQVTHNITGKVSYPYRLHNTILETKHHNPYLGVELDEKLNWKEHLTSKVNKATKQLNFVRRNLYKCPQDIKEQAYLALVRPHLEYSSSVWDPHWKKDINKVEMVQHRAARFVTANYIYQPGSMTSILNQLQWPTLQLRRKVNRIIMFHKVIYHQVAVEIPSYYMPNTRRTRHSHSVNFIQPQCNTEEYRNSFFPRTITEWNRLPGRLVELEDTDTFKVELWSHMYIPQVTIPASIP